MRKLTIATVNFHAPLDPEANQKRMLALLVGLGDKVDLMVFPEAAAQGYAPFREQSSVDYYLKHAIIADESNIFISQMRKVSIDSNTTVIFGLIERSNTVNHEALFDSAVIISSSGQIHKYQKTHLATDEPQFLQSGNDLPVFDIPQGKIGLLICYDKCFPEVARSLAIKGAEILVCVSAWGYTNVNDSDRRNDHSKAVFDIYDQARAVENQCLLVVSNQVGIVGNAPNHQMHFLGGSKIVLPNGKIFGRLDDEEGVLIKTLDLDQALIDERQLNLNAQYLLGNRRPVIYSL